MQANARELGQLVSVFKLGDAAPTPAESSTNEYTRPVQRPPRVAFTAPRLVQGGRGAARRSAAGETPSHEIGPPMTETHP